MAPWGRGITDLSHPTQMPGGLSQVQTDKQRIGTNRPKAVGLDLCISWYLSVSPPRQREAQGLFYSGSQPWTKAQICVSWGTNADEANVFFWPAIQVKNWGMASWVQGRFQSQPPDTNAHMSIDINHLTKFTDQSACQAILPVFIGLKPTALNSSKLVVMDQFNYSQKKVW